jgi:phytoene/squalene synthetase
MKKLPDQQQVKYRGNMEKQPNLSQSLAIAKTKSASKQTYYTIRFLVDRERVANAYRAYGYFRWVDDVLDEQAGSTSEKNAFIQRQQALLEACYRGESWDGLGCEEWMLADLVRSEAEKNSGLQAYLRNMMGVMIFDAGRRGRLITQAELAEYSRMLATAVTEAMYYFIGHDDPVPCHEARYLAVTAAHITHMLRDTHEDIAAGYFNIPREFLHLHGISPRDLESRAYQNWVHSRVQLARKYFRAGLECLAQVKSLRCRLAGYAYTARFEWMLRAIENDNYHLRSDYPERKSLEAGLWMSRTVLASLLSPPRIKAGPRNLAI